MNAVFWDDDARQYVRFVPKPATLPPRTRPRDWTKETPMTDLNAEYLDLSLRTRLAQPGLNFGGVV